MKTLCRPLSVLLAATLALMTACAVPVTLNNRGKNVKSRLRILNLVALICALVAAPRIANGLEVKPPGNRPMATAVSDFAISTGCNDQTKPVAGYDWWSGQYLVVWEDWCHGLRHDDYSQPWINAARVSSTGDVSLCSPISYLNVDALGTPIVARYNPVITFDWVGHRFLIIWSQVDGSGYAALMGRLYSPNCEPLTPEFVITSGFSYFRHYSAAYSADAGEYLAVFTDGATVFGRRINSQNGSLVGLAIPLVGNTNHHDYSEPVVAYDQASHSYLLAWVDDEVLEIPIKLVRMRIVNGDGSVSGATTICEDCTVAGLRIAFEPETNRFLVVTDIGIAAMGQVFHIDGAWLIVDTCGFFVAEPVDGKPRRRPELSYDFHNHGFVVVYERGWAADDTDIMARLVDSSGAVMTAEKPLRDTIGNEARPAISVGDGGRYLLVWEDNRNQGTTKLDLYGGIYINSRTFVPSALR